jgi:hypothetical protein
MAEMLLYGFISAFGWWGANHYVIEPHLEGKPATMEKEIQKQICTTWEEVKNPDGTVTRTRTCEK